MYTCPLTGIKWHVGRLNPSTPPPSPPSSTARRDERRATNVTKPKLPVMVASRAAQRAAKRSTSRTSSRRASRPASAPTQLDPEAEVKRLEAAFRADPVPHSPHLSALFDRIAACDAGSDGAIHAARHALHTLLADNLSAGKKPARDNDGARPPPPQSLTPLFRAYAAALVAALRNPDAPPALHDAAVASAALARHVVFTDVLHAALRCEPFCGAARLHAAVSRFDDLQTLALEAVRDTAPLTDPYWRPGGAAEYGADEVHDAPPAPLPARLRLLRACDAPPTASAPACAVDRVTARRARAARVAAWLSVLGDASLQVRDRTERLTAMREAALERVGDDALAFADALTASYDGAWGGTVARGDGTRARRVRPGAASDTGVAVAALDALFHLVSRHGLDYPRFYHKLYRLLTPSALARPFRNERFLNLVAAFLRRGAGLSEALVAAFVKRLVRRALLLPPADALWCTRLALDLLYAHPAVHTLVHRADAKLLTGDGDAAAAAGAKRKRAPLAQGVDPFDDDESDPELSRAAESSLWELEVLQRHVSPAVSRLVSAFSRDVRKRPKPVPGSLDDYVSLAFDDVFDAEVKRKAKSAHVAYEAPGTHDAVVALRKQLDPALSWE